MLPEVVAILPKCSTCSCNLGNNNELVFKTFDIAREKHPDTTPLFHSDRGFQYTSKIFHKKLVDAGMTQSMSRVSKCIDNGPIA